MKENIVSRLSARAE